MNIDVKNKKKIGFNCKISNTVRIVCNNLTIGDQVEIDDNVNIFCQNNLIIGDLSYIGKNSKFNANNIIIGKEFFNSKELIIGGGGWYNPNANIKIGNNCVMHNNHLNVNKEINIGNHVGLSPKVDLITHGYWNSILEGFPFKEGPITINDEVIIGWRSIILPGVTIGKYSVIGAHSVVTTDIKPFSVCAGNPAKVIKKINFDKISNERKLELINLIVKEYKELLSFKKINNVYIFIEYPFIILKDICEFNVETKKYNVLDNEKYDLIDDFRDFIRRKGIWFFGRRFQSIKRW